MQLLSQEKTCGSPVGGNFVNLEIVNQADALRVSLGTPASLLSFCLRFIISLEASTMVSVGRNWRAAYTAGTNNYSKTT